MSRKKKREEETNVAAGFGDDVHDGVAPRSIGRITPIDVQQKSFGKTRLRRGYDERDVDQFLDEVTEELARQVTENKSLREQVQRADMRATTPLGSDAADADAVVRQAQAEAARILAEARDDAAYVVAEARGEAVAILEAAHGEAGTVARPAAVGAVAAGAVIAASGDTVPDREFIHREREFLQRLAELIQGHAEAIREDLKRVRGATQAPGESEGPGDEDGGPAEPVPTDEAPAADAAAAADEPTGETDMTGVFVASASETTSTDEPPVAFSHPTTPDEPEDAAEPTPVVPEAAPAEGVEGPTPMATGQADPDADADERSVGLAEQEPALAASGSEEEPAMLDLASSESEETPEEPDPAIGSGSGPLAGSTEEGTAPAHASEASGSGEATEQAAEPATVGVTANASSGSFGRWMEETGQAPSGTEGEEEEEPDSRSLRELFWGED